jgi:endonuclease/exonuclease/phosphatase family metal-dependent hydrolase
MGSKFRVFTRRILVILNAGVVLLFLLACLAPYFDPQTLWFISFLGLMFPFLLLGILGFLGWWLFIKPKYAWISTIALILGLYSISVFISFHFPTRFDTEKNPKAIRIATWNVARFIEMKRNNNKGSQTRLKMMEQIRQENADILCMQEFFHSYDSAWYANLDYIRDKLNYPYFFYSHDIDGDKHFTGSVIFSRYPIIDSGIIRYPRPTLPEALIHADIRVNNRIIRVYTTHLQSVQLGKSDYQKIEKIKEGDEGFVQDSKTIFSKLRKSIANRKIQTDIIRQVLGDSPYPVVFCADLNDVPNSYTYFKVKGRMQDAFLRKGSGIGRTFSAISPTLRIDYIFTDDHFRISQFKRIVRRYSDHYMLMADIELKASIRAPGP